MKNYSSVYFNFYVFKQRKKGRIVLTGIVASITRVYYALNFFMNQYLFDTVVSKYFNLPYFQRTPVKEFNKKEDY